MSENNEFHDSLDDVIARAAKKFDNIASQDDDSSKIMNEPVEEIVEEEPSSEIVQPPVVNYVNNSSLFDDVEIDDEDEDIYGKNDFDKEIEEDDRRREMEHAQKLEEARAREEDNKLNTLPPQSLDKEFQRTAIDFQTNKISIVTGMVERVKAKYHLKGGINPNKSRAVMGDLVEYYENFGEDITPEFEQIILKNWQHVDDNGEPYPDNQPNTNATTDEASQTTNTPKEDPDVNINIDVEPNQPVTVNVDDEVIKAINKKRIVNINVREITNKDMKKVVVIENSPKEGVVRSFDRGLGYTPITLPLSGYRCMIKPMNFFDMIAMTSPDNNSIIDYNRKRWSTIYDHLKNPSIGDFKDFDDFLMKTKYNDLQLLEWGLLTATSDDEETITLECGNPKCKQEFVHVYTPRTLIHPVPERMPKEFEEISTAGYDRAHELFDQINGKRTRYILPNSKIQIEINEPSAYEYIFTKLPLIMDKYAAKFPEDKELSQFANIQQNAHRDPRFMEFALTSSMIMRISAIVIPPPDNEKYDTPHEYRYTDWDTIEQQLGMLEMEDTLAVFKLLSEADQEVPIEFYISDIQCPHCGRKEPRGLPVSSLVENLIFRVSRRLQNTEINLMKLD